MTAEEQLDVLERLQRIEDVFAGACARNGIPGVRFERVYWSPEEEERQRATEPKLDTHALWKKVFTARPRPRRYRRS